MSMSQSLLSGMKSLVQSPTRSFYGVAPASPKDWSFESLSVLPSEQLLTTLNSVSGRLEARTLEVDTVLPALVKLCASNNAKVKASVCEVIVMVSNGVFKSSDKDVGLLVVNVLSKDLNDPNPEIRATAVSTICSLAALADSYALLAINKGLRDSNPVVRKQAVIGCGKTWAHSPAIVQDNGLIDELYSMIRDPDPSVITFALQTLNIILKGEGGVVISNNMISYLLQRLPECPEKEQVFLLNYLRLHRNSKPKNRIETSLLIMNSIDPLLEVKSGSLVLAAAQLFSTSISTLKEDQEKYVKILKDFIDRIKSQLSRFMNAKGNESFKVTVMKFIEELPPESSLMLKDLVKDFKIKDRDGTDVSCSKLNLLSEFYVKSLKLDEDVSEFQEEIFEYLCDEVDFNGDLKLMELLVELLVHIDINVHKCPRVNDEEKSKICTRVHLVFADKVQQNPSVGPILLKKLYCQIPQDHVVNQEIRKTLNESICEVAVFRICNEAELKLKNENVKDFCCFIIQTLEFMQSSITSDSPYHLEIILEDIFLASPSPIEKINETLYLKHALLKQLCRTAFSVMKAYPPATQYVLAKVIRYLKQQDVPEIQDLLKYQIRCLVTAL